MNVFQYAFTAEANWKENLSYMTSFTPSYTFYSDFSIAEFCEVYMHDANAVVDTYKRVKESWGKDIKAITEVCMVLNHKIWSFYDGVDSSYLKCSEEWRQKFSELYQSLYDDCTEYIQKTFGNDSEAMSYYYEVTD